MVTVRNGYSTPIDSIAVVPVIDVLVQAQHLDPNLRNDLCLKGKMCVTHGRNILREEIKFDRLLVLMVM